MMLFYYKNNLLIEISYLIFLKKLSIYILTIISFPFHFLTNTNEIKKVSMLNEKSNIHNKVMAHGEELNYCCRNRMNPKQKMIGENWYAKGY